jgi:hypothetical protein
MEMLGDKQMAAGVMLGHELVGMLHDMGDYADRKDKEGESKLQGGLIIDRAALDPMEWGPVFRNFAEVVSQSLRPQLVEPSIVKPGERDERALLRVSGLGQRSNLLVRPSRAERKAAKWAYRVLRERRR